MENTLPPELAKKLQATLKKMVDAFHAEFSPEQQKELSLNVIVHIGDCIHDEGALAMSGCESHNLAAMGEIQKAIMQRMIIGGALMPGAPPPHTHKNNSVN